MKPWANVEESADELDDSIFGHVVPDCFNATRESGGFEEMSFSSSLGEERGFSPASCSTPRKSTATTRGPSTKKPATERLPCSQCGETYANRSTLAVHTKMHNMAIVSKRIPKEQEMLQLTKFAIEKSLGEIQEENPRSDATDNLCVFCKCVESCVANGEGEEIVEFFSRYFMSILKELNVLLPSALRSIVFVRTNRLLGSEEFVSEMISVLSVVGETDAKVLNAFVGHVCWKVFNWQFVMCLRIIRGHSIHDDTPVRQRLSSDAAHPVEFQQLVYHIGGAVLKGVLKKSKLYPSNANWVEYGRIVSEKFLTTTSGTEPEDCLAHVNCFTQGRDRGGLKYLDSDAFNLFLVLFDIIQCQEGSDGSLPLEVVEDKVYNHDILMFIWDELVGTELSEEQSLHLFSDIVRCCTKVTAKGILKRRLNESLTKAYSSVPLRSVLSRN